MKAAKELWDDHYRKSKSRLTYPDENLVRLLSDLPPGAALDLGCGSGRHLPLLENFGFHPVIGADSSETSIALCRTVYPQYEFHLLTVDENSPGSLCLNFDNASLQLVILWGVLHYNGETIRERLLREVARVLAPSGTVLGTLRAGSDTHLRDNADLPGVAARYFDEAGTRALLDKHFAIVELGYMERTPIGDLNRKISHWIFRCGQMTGPDRNDPESGRPGKS